MQDQLLKKASKIEDIKATLKQSSVLMNKQVSEDTALDLKPELQKSFIGGVPTDNIIDLLDEEEDVIERKLQEVNEANDPDREILDKSDDSFGSRGSRGLFDDSDEDEVEGMDNGIKHQTDPQILKL